MADELKNLQTNAAALKSGLTDLFSLADTLKARLDALGSQTSISPADVQAVADDLATDLQAVKDKIAADTPST